MNTARVNMKGVHISKILPVPENFYDIKKTCNLIATPATIYPYTLALYVAGIASFASFFLYYSQESNYIKETVVQSTYDIRHFAREGLVRSALAE